MAAIFKCGGRAQFFNVLWRQRALFKYNLTFYNMEVLFKFTIAGFEPFF